MSPLLAPPKHVRSREETSSLVRLRSIFSILSPSFRKHDRPCSERNPDDQHHSAHSSIHSYMSSFKYKFRRMNSSSSTPESKGIFSFRALDSRRLRTRSSASDFTAIDRYILTNAQTIANDSTDQKLIQMLVEDMSARRRSSIGSFLSVNPVHGRRRYSMASSDLTVASEDLTSREFAEHCGINVYPEDEYGDEVFESGISILVQQHRLSGNHQQSTILSSTKSVKSKISIMEDTFWTPPSNDSEKGDEDLVSRTSSESAEAYTRPEGTLTRRNSFITFAEAPNFAKHKRPGSSNFAARSGRHSAPIPIPKPILVCPGNHADTIISASTNSTDSSFTLSCNSFTTHSTTSSVGTSILTSSRPASPKRGSIESSSVATITKSDLSKEPIAERPPSKVKKGRFEITFGDAPAPTAPPPSVPSGGGDGSSAAAPTEETCLVFQMRKYRKENTINDGDCSRRPLEERRRSMSMSVIE